MGFLNKIKDVKNSALEKATETVQKKKENAELSKISREDMLKSYNDSLKTGDLTTTLKVENFDGPTIGTFNFKIENFLFKLNKGEELQLSMDSGVREIDINYSIVSAHISFDFQQPSIIQIGLDSATNTMKVQILDTSGNPIEGSKEAIKNDSASSLLKKSTVTDNQKYMDADMRIFGENGQLYLYPDKIIITRDGFAAKANLHFSKEKIIEMSNVSRVTTNDVGFRGVGFIKIWESSKNELIGTLIKPEIDPNAVTLYDNKVLASARDYIENHKP